MIAMGLACKPKIFIADEPTTALDVTIQAQIVDLVKDLREVLNTTIIWITHDLSLIAGLVDRIMVMYAGYVVEEALVDDLYEDPRHPYTIGLFGSLARNRCKPTATSHDHRRRTAKPGSLAYFLPLCATLQICH